MLHFPDISSFSDQLLLAVPESYDINKKLSNYSFSATDICKLAHLSEKHPAISLSAFKDVPFLLLFNGSNFYERATNMFQEAGLSPNIKMQLSQSVTAFRCAAAGLGATFVVDRLVKESDNRLKYYKIDSPHAKRHNYLLYPKAEVCHGRHEHLCSVYFQKFLVNVIIHRPRSSLISRDKARRMKSVHQ